MKKLFILFFLILLLPIKTLADNCNTDRVKVFESKNHAYYGLKDSDDKTIVDADYRKLIPLGETSWIFQKKNYKFGLMDCNGNILVEPKYTHVERLFDKWLKLGNDRDYGIYDQTGKIIVPPKFSAIEPLFGGKFLTYKNYKYGIYSDSGKEILPNEYDFIYMPNFKTLRIKKQNNWYEVEQIDKDTAISLPSEVVKKFEDETFQVTQMVKNTGLGAGYGIVTATDYTLKVFSAVSEAYEDTIDELLLSKGVETVNILMKFSWIPKFPAVFAKKYYYNILHPDNSPLSEVRNDIKENIK